MLYPSENSATPDTNTVINCIHLLLLGLVARSTSSSGARYGVEGSVSSQEVKFFSFASNDGDSARGALILWVLTG